MTIILSAPGFVFLLCQSKIVCLDIPVILDSSGIDIFFSFIILKSLSPIVMIGLLIWYRWHMPTIPYHSLFYKKIILPFPDILIEYPPSDKKQIDLPLCHKNNQNPLAFLLS
jgi:hypothetical protein